MKNVKAALKAFNADATQSSANSIFKASLPSLLRIIDTPISLSIAMRLKYNVAGYPDVHPHNYDLLHDGIERYKLDNQALALVSKSNIIDRGVDTELAAKLALVESEEKNKASNDRLAPYFHFNKSSDLKMHAIINSARDYLRNLMGPAEPDFRLVFTGGATSTVRGNDKIVVNKIHEKPSMTIKAARHFYSAIWGDPAAYAYAEHHKLIDDAGFINLDSFNMVETEEIFFVDKNWKTKRLICLQNTINMSLQKSCADQWKRSLLFKQGVDLNHTPDLHAKIIESGCFRGHNISTIDLKAASDRICRNLVRLLVTPDWYVLLSDITHKKWSFGDDTFLSSKLPPRPERFSAMGNGFTFELETLIFRSICFAVLNESGVKGYPFSVFGDDIIFPTKHAERLVEVLSFFGFETNHEKTFINSPFLESCGNDVYYGYPSRAIYFKDFEKGIRGYYALLNRLRLLSESIPSRENRIHGIWCDIVRKLRDFDSRVLCAGPRSLGDSVVWCSDRDANKFQFGSKPFTRDFIRTCYGVHKKEKLNCFEYGSTYLDLAYMLTMNRSDGQLTAKPGKHCAVKTHMIVGDNEYDWLTLRIT